jgi:hypothetical protein
MIARNSLKRKKMSKYFWRPVATHMAMISISAEAYRAITGHLPDPSIQEDAALKLGSISFRTCGTQVREPFCPCAFIEMSSFWTVRTMRTVEWSHFPGRPKLVSCDPGSDPDPFQSQY